VNLVDSCGWLEYMADGPNADFFAPPVENTDELLVPSICVAEVFRRVLQQRDEAAALGAATAMGRGQIIDLTWEVALEAARLGVELRLPLTDSVILASARVHEATVWTQDADFEGIEGVRYIPTR
jgi:predicted nucleic acid-binding protein